MVRGKWSFYDVMNFLEYCLQRRTMEIFQREQLQLKLYSLTQMKMKWTILNTWTTEKIIHNEKMEGVSSKKSSRQELKEEEKYKKLLLLI